MTPATFDVVAHPHPFHSDPVMATCAHGLTIADVMGNASHSANVTLDGYPVAREQWGRLRPKAGHTLHVIVYPQGGNAGKYIRMAALIALSIWAPYIAGYAQTGVWSTAAANAAAGWATATVMVLGSLAITPMVGHAREIAA